MGSDSDIFSCLESINKWKPTVFASVPRIWRGILAAAKTRRSVDISSVRMGISAGEYLPECLAEDLLKTLGVSVIDGFGGTELLHIVMARKVGEAFSSPLPSVTATVRAEDGTILQGNARGRLHIASPMMATEYLNRPAASKNVFHDGGVYTGDICLQDELGHHRWLSRNDDLLLLGGMRVPPREIEDVVGQIPTITECAVVPVTTDDGLQDALVKIVAPGQNADELMALVRARLRELIPIERRPRFIQLCDRLPRTHSGKTSRKMMSLQGTSRQPVGLRTVFLNPRSRGATRILIIPCAGGSAATYTSVKPVTPDNVMVLSANLDDPRPNSFGDLLDEWRRVVKRELNRGDILIGHSFGAIIASELASRHPTLLSGMKIVLAAPVLNLGVISDQVATGEGLVASGLLPDRDYPSRILEQVLAPRFRKDLSLEDIPMELTIPTDSDYLVIGGANDPFWPAFTDSSSKIHDLNKHMITLPESGHHLVPCEWPAVLEILKGRGFLPVTEGNCDPTLGELQ